MQTLKCLFVNSTVCILLFTSGRKVVCSLGPCLYTYRQGGPKQERRQPTEEKKSEQAVLTGRFFTNIILLKFKQKLSLSFKVFSIVKKNEYKQKLINDYKSESHHQFKNLQSTDVWDSLMYCT